MRTRLEEITPELALEYLKHNTGNRAIRQKAVDEYAQEMISNRWVATHQGIAFYDDGELADGQHRLLAIVESGCTVQMMVTRGIPRKVAESGLVSGDMIDMGRTRSTADQLARSHGVTNQNMVAAALRVVAAICYPSALSARLTPGKALAVSEFFGDKIDDMILAVQKFKPARRAPVTGTLAFISRACDIQSFIDKLVTGINLNAGDPALALRNHLSGLPSASTRASITNVAEQVANAVYYHIQGNKLTHVKRGAQGIEFFKNKQKPTVEKVRRALGAL